ncbi:MAG: hypothetical protein A2521_08020 [Deltaproteobacteria bacterium RIFOXYD12_FULL_57_12]|nr:MAG: hypothetical protein A2521_08020 [Deltaproteobacteria bacterium RIFOXYD12_FULL_57_12]
MQVKWTAKAVADLQAIRRHIEQDKALAARKLVLRIIRLIEEDLTHQPGMGRPGRKQGTRELVISGTPYFVPYLVRGSQLVIIRVLHGAMQWPAEPGNVEG